MKNLDAAQARDLCPRAFGEPAVERARRTVLWFAFIAAIMFSFWWTGFDPMRIINGLGKLGWLIGAMFPPTHAGMLADLLGAMAETLAMAFLGTVVAALISIPIGLLGARTTSPLGSARALLRRMLDILRGIDSLILALIFVAVVGLGPFAGILAIAVGDIGTLSKLFAEAFENADRKQVDGVRSCGASENVAIRFGLMPQTLPVVLSQTLYHFESNVRSATILGIVGAGGIGMQLSDRIRINEWNDVSFIIIMILVTVAAIDYASGWLRGRIIGR